MITRRKQELAICVVRLGELRIEIERLASRNACRVDIPEEHLCIRQSGPGQRGSSIQFRRAAIVRYGTLQQFLVQIFAFQGLLLVVPGENHELVRRRILRGRRDNQICRFGENRSNHRIRDLLLHREKLPRTASKRFVPDRYTAVTVYQRHRNPEDAALTSYASFEYRLHAKQGRHFPRIQAALFSRY